jgi:hypothetical protein
MTRPMRWTACSLDPQMRIGCLSEYLEPCRELLHARYRGSSTARRPGQRHAASTVPVPSIS